MSQRTMWCVTVALLAPSLAAADGGSVQISVAGQGCRITVMTSPNPLRPGPIDVSVLVQDEKSSAVISDVRCAIALRQKGRTIRGTATRAAATNKLFRSAQLELPQAGQWTLEANVQIAGREILASTEVLAAEPLPAVSELWLWTGWPIIAIGLFLANQRLKRSPSARLKPR